MRGLADLAINMAVGPPEKLPEAIKDPDKMPAVHFTNQVMTRYNIPSYVSNLPVPGIPIYQGRVPNMHLLYMPVSYMPVPNMNLPGINMPRMPIPQMDINNLRVPGVQMPTINMPKLPVPQKDSVQSW